MNKQTSKWKSERASDRLEERASQGKASEQASDRLEEKASQGKAGQGGQADRLMNGQASNFFSILSHRL